METTIFVVSINGRLTGYPTFKRAVRHIATILDCRPTEKAVMRALTKLNDPGNLNIREVILCDAEFLRVGEDK